VRRIFAIGAFAAAVFGAASCGPKQSAPALSPEFAAQGREVLAMIERCDRAHRGPFITYDPLRRTARRELEDLHANNKGERGARRALENYLSAIEFVRGDWEHFDQTARAKIQRDETARATAESDARRLF
jgi:hypothetical protein